MIYVGIPVGSDLGWPVLGKQILFEMAKLADVRLLVGPQQSPNPFVLPRSAVNDDIEWHRLQGMTLGEPPGHPYVAGSTVRLPGPVIQASFGIYFEPFVPQIEPPYAVGFAVFEGSELPQAGVENARRLYRHLATGSTYCSEVLKQHGFHDVSTVLHGVDADDFHPRPEPRAFLRDQFVVFSGGKFELRKGQDIVIRAYKVLQDRHPDVFLVNAWFNNGLESMNTMGASPLIQYQPPDCDNHVDWMNGLLAANGLDLSRVLTVGRRENRLMAPVYHATDVGLFPNRVEGGTNMVLMEYMACGKPVIAAYNSGHRDVVDSQCALLIERHTTMTVKSLRDGHSNTWSGPDLDETIEKLEWCYQHRDQLPALGQRANERMKQFPWSRVAQGLLDCARVSQ